MAKKNKAKKIAKVVTNPASQIKNKKLRTVVGLATNPAATIADTVKKSKKSKLKSLFKKGLDVAKAVAPIAASSIPGVGGIAAQALSTLNDDSWFSEDTGNGAAFNELLKGEEIAYNALNKRSTNQVIASVMEIVTAINAGPKIKDEFMPMVLAYVRKQTGNVLVDSVDQYYSAIVATEYLYAIYYTLRKIEKLALNIPVNIPTVTNTITIASPQYVNQMIGIADSLESYLKGTTGLPYALTAYIRWRFGSLFHSDNTGKPGLIMYNPPLFDSQPNQDFSNASSCWMNDGQFVTTNSGNGIISSVADTISYLKEIITASGRAAADLHIAYQDNGIEYDVEDAHYDSKEYNLRCNLKYVDEYFDITATHMIVKDSRLDMNAAIQAIVLSTPDGSTSYYDNDASNDTLNLFPIWDWTLSLYVPDYDNFLSNTTRGATLRTNSIGPKRAMNWYPLSMSDATFTDVSAATFDAIVKHFIVSKALASLQCHNWVDMAAASDVDVKIEIFGQPLAYDTARVSESSISAIHRSAIKNLFRGQFTRADQEAAIKARAQKAVKDLDSDISVPQVMEVA